MVLRSTLASARNVTYDSAEVIMQDDMFPAAEKILSDIENVVKKDTSLRSFEIVPADDNENKSPVFHQEQCLALASWCVQPLYCYVYRRLLELRQNRHRREEPSTVARWLLGALLLNPDVTTFWNMRRELVRSDKLDPFQEIPFTRLVLYHKPNCFEAFAYRRFLLPYLLDAKEEHRYITPENDEYSDTADANKFPLCVEIDIAEKCANNYASNYHAWSHRRHVVMLRESRGYVHPTLESEWVNTQRWCCFHVSDYSGLSYRQFLLKKYVSESRAGTTESLKEQTRGNTEWRRQTIYLYIESYIDKELLPEVQQLFDALRADDEVEFVESARHACFRALSYWVEECRANAGLIFMHSDHEALWCHRKFLANHLAHLIRSYRKFHCYKNEPISASYSSMLPVNDDVESLKKITDDPVDICHDFLIKAFCNNNKQVLKLVDKPNKYEKQLMRDFREYLKNIFLPIKQPSYGV